MARVLILPLISMMFPTFLSFRIMKMDKKKEKKKSGSVRLDPVRETLIKTEIINRAKKLRSREESLRWERKGEK